MSEASGAQASVLSELLDYSLSFSVLEIGARPVGGEREPFHALLDLFPASRMSALEIDPALCDELNRNAPRGQRYYSCALGGRNESRTLYETVHPMCSSLYEPDSRYADLYQALEVMRPKGTSTIRTTALDDFVRDSGIGPVDFIKLDIQGAELEVLEGGSGTLERVLAVVSEVMFVPLYKNQPLYGDIDAYLRRQGFMLHKFLAIAGRVMKPLKLRGSGTHPLQMLWTDALFTRDLRDLSGLDPDAVLKLAVLLDLYGSPDAVHYLLRRYDELSATRLASEYLEEIKTAGSWNIAQ
ncbi:MAG TPA: FkbM family methyltransferase [Burkholderiales bacterium]|nr:FkbM family methyltransferase [Burkholderiales bacterium]